MVILSRRAVVSYWLKNIISTSIDKLPRGLPRNSVDRLSERARNDRKSFEGP